VERQLVEVAGVLLLARAVAAAGVAHRERERLGYERLLDDDVVGAGAGQADDIPDVDDLVLVPRDEEGAEVDDLPFLVEDEPTEENPGGVGAAGREAPATGQVEPALSLDGLAGRRV
jgi:hypothetical protein